MKTTISKKELEKIYNIACKDWKSTIKEYACRNPFGDEVTFSESEIEKMVEASTKEQLPIVKKIFDIKNTFESIKTIQDAVAYLGESDEEVITLRLLQNVINLARHVVAEQELVVVIKALNKKHTLDWNNPNQQKWYNWFYLGNDFRFFTSGCFTTCSDCSSRLCLKSEELANYCANQFKDIYKDYMNK